MFQDVLKMYYERFTRQDWTEPRITWCDLIADLALRVNQRPL